jgi:hypothetical protein
MLEVWKVIEGWPDYAVSNLGRGGNKPRWRASTAWTPPPSVTS